MKQRTGRGWLLCCALSIIFLTTVAVFWPGHSAWAEADSEGVIDGRDLSVFEGVGHIDRLGEDEIVIDDLQKKLTSRVKYYRVGRKHVNRSAFKVGDRVGYIANSRGELVSLWLLR